MAKAKSIFRIQGDLGGVNFSLSGGEMIAKDTTTLSGDRIHTDPAFQRTRENMKEFRVATHVGAEIRKPLQPMLRNISKRNMTGQLMSRCYRVLKNTIGTRGQRSFELSLNRYLLEGFNFGDLPFGTALTIPWTLSPSGTRTAADWEIPAFNPVDYLNVPQGATHFRPFMGLVTISDYGWDALQQRHVAQIPEEHGISVIEYGVPHLLSQPVAAPILLSATLPNLTSALNVNVSLLVVLAIEYSQEIGSVHYKLASGNAAVIAGVF